MRTPPLVLSFGAPFVIVCFELEPLAWQPVRARVVELSDSIQWGESSSQAAEAPQPCGDLDELMLEWALREGAETKLRSAGA